MRKLVFADTETTGLSPQLDKLVELSYAVEDNPIKTLYFGVKKVEPFIDNLIKFTERGLAAIPASSIEEMDDFIGAIEDNTLVAANPSFDRDFMEFNGLWAGHYRMLDIESYAMKALDLDYVPSMNDIYNLLTERGYKLTKPDHTSARDVESLRQAYYILRYM